MTAAMLPVTPALSKFFRKIPTGAISAKDKRNPIRKDGVFP